MIMLLQERIARTICLYLIPGIFIKMNITQSADQGMEIFKRSFLIQLLPGITFAGTIQNFCLRKAHLVPQKRKQHKNNYHQRDKKLEEAAVP